MTRQKTNAKRSAAAQKVSFSARVRQLRTMRAMTQTDLATRMSVSVSYISKVENDKLHFGDYPSEKFIHKLAGELKADEDELLLLADKVPASIRERIQQRPELFRKLAKLNTSSLDAIELAIESL